jgi:hypothetical protein
MIYEVTRPIQSEDINIVCFVRLQLGHPFVRDVGFGHRTSDRDCGVSQRVPSTIEYLTFLVDFPVLCTQPSVN